MTIRYDTERRTSAGERSAFQNVPKFAAILIEDGCIFHSGNGFFDAHCHLCPWMEGTLHAVEDALRSAKYHHEKWHDGRADENSCGGCNKGLIRPREVVLTLDEARAL